MQTTIKQVNPVEYELEVHASAEDLAPDLQKALKAQRSQTVLKGFRPGKVPLPLVKKMYGKALGLEVAGQKVQELYEAEVLGRGEHEVLGQPKVTTFEYELDGELHAVLQFGVRPEVELQDLSGVKLNKLAHTVTGEEIDRAIERLRQQHADLVPQEAEAEEADFVVVDLQRLDDASGTPIIGEKEEDVSFFLDDERVLDELKQALVGKKAGDTVRVELPHHAHEEAPASELLELPGQHDHPAGDHAHAFQVTVKDVKRRDLAELDPAFFKQVTGSDLEDEDAFREEVTRQLQQSWDRQARELLEARIVERMLALHTVPVPESVVEMYLDSFVEDVRQRNRGDLPEGFDEAAFRAANRQEAEQQGRWMLVRDQVIRKHDLQVTEDDLQQHFEQEAGRDARVGAAQLRQLYQSLGVMDRIEQRLLSEKVFATLAAHFDVTELDQEAFEQALEQEQEEAAPAGEAPAEPE